MTPLTAGRLILSTLCALLLIVPGVADAKNFGPSSEFRSVNTERYEISVQKNGRLDVLLPSRELLIENAYPMILFADEDEPEPLPVRGRNSSRELVNNPLGRGQGFFFSKDGCEWIIATYPTKSFFTVQVAFVNTTKKPVKVKALYPWVVGGAKEGSLTLGPGTADARVLECGSQTNPQANLKKSLDGKTVSFWNLAVTNPAAQRSLITGFLTARHGMPQVRIQRTEAAAQDSVDVFRAECIYDPPIEVPPDCRIESETFYIDLTEPDPLVSLEQFGRAIAEFNGLPLGGRRQALRATPHGWDSWSTANHNDITEKVMVEQLEFVDKNLKRYGWTHISIDDGWQRATGDWEADPEKFPHGMKWFADQVHAKGMTAGIWIDPFTVKLGTPLAEEHPDWLIKPFGFGRTLLGDDERILDVTAEGAAEYVKALFTKITREWGYDAIVEADFVYHLLVGEAFADPAVTRVEVLRKGMGLIRTALGDDKFLMSTPPYPINSVFVDGLRLGIDCGPIWRKSEDHWAWGCVDTLTNAAQRFYFTPHVWVPDQDCAFFGRPETRERWKVTGQPELTLNQSIAWLTGATLTGGVVKLGDPFTSLKPEEVAVLSRLMPTPPIPARPVDLFERDHPAIWSLPVKSPIGEWVVAGLFNWDENESERIHLDLAAFGLDPRARYTVYDFWQDEYYGVARGEFDVNIGPAQVRLLGLKPYMNRPMFLATDRHYSQGASDHKSLEWDAQQKVLKASFKGIADTDYNLRVLVPSPYEVKSVTVSTGDPEVKKAGEVLAIKFHCAQDGMVDWAVQF